MIEEESLNHQRFRPMREERSRHKVNAEICQVAKLQQSLTEATSVSAVLREKFAAMTTTLESREESEREERERLAKRADDLAHQNQLLHEEAGKLSARILTLQELWDEPETTTPSPPG
ncbi:hypothetical protein GBAR_LOCUS17183 [Geodia barretti]|uniref:Uncharacterized protein n=1 Tax=Geodia barretti TaxID=519541 RepID=A0AA35SIY5_GEOBA|nr:hypothetical protein GBAR_LOCUS17183 [Geodia barretti]